MKLTAGDAFRFTTVNGVVVDNRERAAEFARLARLSQEPVRLGELGGHTVMARNYRDFNTYQEVIELQVQGVPEVTTRRMVPYGERVAITNGMVIQFENMVAKIPSKLQEAQLRLAQCQDTIVQYDRLIGRPFPQAVELAAAQDRFQQTSGLLQAMDGQAELQDPSAEQAIARARTLTQQANATGTGADARDKLRRMADELRAQGEPPEADREPVSYTHLDVYKRQPDSSEGRWSSRSPRPSEATTWSKCAGSGLRPARSSGRTMFCRAVSVGSRLNAWKTNPTRSRRTRVSSLSERAFSS